MTATSYIPMSTTRSVDVAELLPRISHGDPRAWEEILRRYGELVTATVRSFRLQHADTVDAIQTTWLRLAENTHRIHTPERLAGWLVTTARRECLHILRQTPRTTSPLDLMNLADPARGPERRALDADTARALWTLIEQLSPRQQTLLRALLTDHSRTYADITRTTGIPIGAIGPTRARALAQLRGKLEQHQSITRPAPHSTRSPKRSIGT